MIFVRCLPVFRGSRKTSEEDLIIPSQDSTQKKTSVEDLPHECLALILARLHSKADRNAASLTCRRWRALEALSRHTLRFTPARSTPPLSRFLHGALIAFPHISTISINGSSVRKYKLPASFFTLMNNKHFAQLTSLRFEDCFNINDNMACLALGCPALTNLAFNMCDITDVGLQCLLAHGLTQLISLAVPNCDVTDVGIDVVLTRCTNMEEIIVEENSEIKGWGFRHGKKLRKIEANSCDCTSVGLAEGLQGPTSLRTLRLPYISFWPMLESIGEYCKFLEVLSLKWSLSLDDFSLRIIVQGCQNLRVLDVDWCHEVTLLGWQALALSSSKLKELDVHQCENFCGDSLLAIGNGCPSLCSLKISDLFLPPNSTFLRFRESRPSIKVKFYDCDDIQIRARVAS